MQITRTADYGVRVMMRLAASPAGTRMTVAELARDSHASPAYTAKILQRLAGVRLVVSRRGFDGGFELAKAASEISLLDIVGALDGPLCLNECAPGGAGCEYSTACAARDVWVKAQEAVAAVLGAQRLDGLVTAPTVQ